MTTETKTEALEKSHAFAAFLVDDLREAYHNAETPAEFIVLESLLAQAVEVKNILSRMVR